MLRFLILCALLSWPLQVAASLVPGLALPLLALAGLGPTLAATIVTRGAVWRALREGPALGWLVVALLGPFALAALAAAVEAALGGAVAIAMPFLGAIVLPPIGEELGWRGYMQPTLAASRGRLAAALAVGAAWAVWHAVPAALGGADALAIARLAVSVVAWSIVLGWLVDRRGGVWLAIALHAAINASTLIVADSPRADVLRLGAVIAAAALAARARR